MQSLITGQTYGENIKELQKGLWCQREQVKSTPQASEKQSQCKIAQTKSC